MTKLARNEKLAFFPYGTQYHRAPTPLPEEWEQDLKEIARVGYTHIQLRPQWRWHERIRGKPGWDDLDRLFDLSGQCGLRVILKPMLETAPDWVFQELSGSRIGFHGVPLSPFANGAYYVGGWWPCFDNPEVVLAAAGFVKTMIARYCHHPALWCYNAWNEPVSRPLGQCHCEHSTRSYQAWLRERFGTIERCNFSLGKAWTSFETVRAPEGATDYIEMFLWRQWAGWAIGQQVRFVAEAIRATDPNAFVMTHAGGSMIVQDPVCGTSDDFENARHVDRYGTSFGIPLHPNTPKEHFAPELQSSWLRRVDPSYWCHEFYPNHANWCVPPSAETLRRLIWMAIAGGATAFTFWQYRSERVGCETNGYGLREVNGAPTPRSEVADEIARILKEHGGELACSKRVPSDIVLLYCRQSDLISRIQKIRARICGIQNEEGDVQYFYKQAIHSAHALHLINGVAPDWVVSGDEIGDRKILHVTAAEMILAETAGWLIEYVEQGGRLLVEYPFACRDEHTWVGTERPLNHLEKLTGCREGLRTVAGHEERATVLGIEGIPAGYWKQELLPEKGDVIGKWSDGTVAAVICSHGKGRVLTLGCSLSLGFSDSWNDPSVNAFRKVMDALGFERRDTMLAGVVHVRRQSAQKDIDFFFNLGQTRCRIPFRKTVRAAWHSQACAEKDATLIIDPGGFWIGSLCKTVI